jgi:hypothetical protein
VQNGAKILLGFRPIDPGRQLDLDRTRLVAGCSTSHPAEQVGQVGNQFRRDGCSNREAVAL